MGDSQPTLVAETVVIGTAPGFDHETGEHVRAGLSIQFTGHMFVDGVTLAEHSTVRLFFPFEVVGEVVGQIVAGLATLVDRRIPGASDAGE